MRKEEKRKKSKLFHTCKSCYKLVILSRRSFGFNETFSDELSGCLNSLFESFRGTSRSGIGRPNVFSKFIDGFEKLLVTRLHLLLALRFLLFTLLVHVLLLDCSGLLLCNYFLLRNGFL